ncbi:hypothetical protein CEXT_348551 [Caerostris extrusa]|uniref:Uncharacterized protein n=1 Tax=Caerostris extrusa TaxID=172846 RepID=A0AAV4Y8B5_CAEEX|nr:hypothetical protein CEXT_348551 [Caerostris extrusa]
MEPPLNLSAWYKSEKYTKHKKNLSKKCHPGPTPVYKPPNPHSKQRVKRGCCSCSTPTRTFFSHINIPVWSRGSCLFRCSSIRASDLELVLVQIKEHKKVDLPLYQTICWREGERAVKFNWCLFRRVKMR